MTGSYSEILDDGKQTDEQSDNVHNNVVTYINDIQKFCNKLEDKKSSFEGVQVSIFIYTLFVQSFRIMYTLTYACSHACLKTNSKYIKILFYI